MILLLPFAAGVVRAGPEPLHIPLLLAWLLGYLTLNATSTWLAQRRTRRPGRHGARAPRSRSAAPTYGLLTGAVAAGLVFVRPDLLPWALFFVPAGAALLAFAAAGRSRSLSSALTAVVSAGAMTLVAYQTGNPPGGTIPVGVRSTLFVTGVVLAYLIGSVLYVRTLIRARSSRGHRTASVAFHAACTLALIAIAAWIHPAGLPRRESLAFAALFAALTLRAAVLGGRRISPALVGIGELFPCLALLLVVARWS